MTRVILLLLLTVAIRGWAADGSWPKVKFSEVRAYAWPGKVSHTAVILEGMKLQEGAINPQGARLTEEQVKVLIKAVSEYHPQYEIARCHIPHNALIFYNAAGKPAASVEICFECCNNRMNPKSDFRHIDLLAIAAIFEAHKLPMGKFANAAAFRQDYEKFQKKEREFREQRKKELEREAQSKPK